MALAGAAYTVHFRGKEIGRVSPHGYYSGKFDSLKRTSTGYKRLGTHATREAAVARVVKSHHPKNFAPPKTPKVKRSVSRIRKPKAKSV
jgi:hypothetical protein